MLSVPLLATIHTHRPPARVEHIPRQWGVVAAVVAAEKEEVGKIEDGEIAMEGVANVITRDNGSVGERRYV